jgi:hypothetical protein
MMPSIKIFNNSLYFENIAKILRDVCCRYNKNNSKFEYEIVNIIDNSDSIYILMNAHKLKIMPKKYILYNFEQLDVDPEYDQSYFDKMKQAIDVWDYSKVNIEYLNNKNIYAKFFPLGFSPSLKIYNHINFSDRANSVMFIGVMNEHRRDFLKPVHTYCKKNDLNMFISNNCWNEDYETICSITKIGINTHYYQGNTILEVHRIIPYIIHHIWVISERSADKWYDDLFADLIDFVDVNNISDRIDQILKMSNQDIEDELLERKRRLINKCDYYKSFLHVFDDNILSY